MNSHKSTVKDLNTLLTRAYDAEKGYLEAAENVDNQALTSLFGQISQNRKGYGKAIKSEIVRLGGDPDEGTSVKADMHRTWMDIKAAFTSGEDAILKECIRGEKATLENYQDFLKEDDLPTSTQSLLKEQASQVRADLDRLKKLEKISS